MGIVLLVAAAPVAPPRTARGEATIEERLEKAWDCTENRKNYDEGLRVAEAIIADRRASRKQKLSAFRAVVAILGKQRKSAGIGEIARRMVEAFPGDAEVLSQTALAQAESLWRSSRTRGQAVATLEEVLPKLGGEKAPAAAVHARLGRMLHETGKHDRAYEQSKAALDTGALDDARVPEVLRDMADAAWSLGDMARCEGALVRLMSPKPFGMLQSWERSHVRDRYGEVLVRQGRYDDARRFYEEQARQEKDPRRRQRYALLLGDIHRDAKRYDEALTAYENVILESGEIADAAYDAQGRIARALQLRGDYAGALKAARICLDAAWDSNRLAGAAQMVAEMLKAVDKHVARANAFIAFQKHGPAGEDGKPGTGDDLTNPLADVGYASYPRREKAFAEARKRAGDDAEASRFAALTCIYTGRPLEALRLYLDAFARSDVSAFGRIGREMIVVGVRAVQGHPHGLQRFFDFANYGPDGPDGKARTADDVGNPFLELGLKPSDFRAEAPGPAPGLSAGDVQVLREARALLRKLAASRLEHSDTQRSALGALVRVQLALGDWPDGPEWFLDQVRAKAGDRRSAVTWLEAGQLAAKAGAPHLGAVHAYWGTVESADRLVPEKSQRDVDRLRKNFERAASGLGKPKPILPRSLRAWKLDPYRMDASRLRPLPEEKAKR